LMVQINLVVGSHSHTLYPCEYFKKSVMKSPFF
jgi:hypothetical protein